MQSTDSWFTTHLLVIYTQNSKEYIFVTRTLTDHILKYEKCVSPKPSFIKMAVLWNRPRFEVRLASVRRTRCDL